MSVSTLAISNPDLGGHSPFLNEMLPVDIKFEHYALKLVWEGIISEANLDLAIREYKRFLILKWLHPNSSLAPTRLQDEMWHIHILDTVQYHRDCAALIGRYLHHQPNFGDDKHETRKTDEAYELMEKLYRLRFGESPPDDQRIFSFRKKEGSAARCQDKKCHVPTPCRCR